MPQLFFSYAGTDREKAFFERHCHRGIELLYVAAGESKVRFIDTEPVVGTVGNVIVIPPHVLHERDASADSRTFFAVFENGSFDFNYSVRKIDTGKDSLIRQWFENLVFLNAIYAPEEAEAILLAILLRLSAIENHQQKLALAHWGLQKACNYITHHYNEKISVSDIAEYSGISPSYLNFLFHEKFGFGPLYYLNDMRMKIARKLLLNRYSNISEVARLCGFSNIHYFSRCFKMFHGVTPSEYRQFPSASADTENRRG